MPDSIDIDTFERADDDEFQNRTDAERVIYFLSANDDRAFTAVRIANETDVGRENINAVLSQLEERGLVRHKEPYSAITDNDERLSQANMLHQANERLNEQYGTEDREEWDAHAPDEPHPSKDQDAD